MLKRTLLAAVTPLLLSLAVLTGCDPNSGDSKTTEMSDTPPATADMDDHGHDHGDHGHAHPSEGPHHGSLIELGNEEFHAELVHDEQAGTITIYVLDGSAKKAVPIDAKEIVINLKHDGKGEQFKLAASPDKGDPEGKSSRFVSSDKDLGHDLDHDDAEARLGLVIAEKNYSGKIEHDHDHEGHDHDHK